LTDRCPTIAVCSVLGAIPITTQIEKNTFTTFCNIAANKEFDEHEIARRQLAIKDQDSNSWFTHTRKLLQLTNCIRHNGKATYQMEMEGNAE
jgi:hypothetical protein